MPDQTGAEFLLSIAGIFSSKENSVEKFNRIVTELLSNQKHSHWPNIPANRYNLNNGTKIVATKDYPFFEMQKGDEILLWWDGEYIRHGGLTWSVESMCNELDNRLWEIKYG